MSSLEAIHAVDDGHHHEQKVGYCEAVKMIDQNSSAKNAHAVYLPVTAGKLSKLLAIWEPIVWKPEDGA